MLSWFLAQFGLGQEESPPVKRQPTICVAWHVPDDTFDEFFAFFATDTRLVGHYYLGMGEDSVHVVSGTYHVATYGELDSFVEEIRGSSHYRMYTSFAGQMDLAHLGETDGARIEDKRKAFSACQKIEPQGNVLVVWRIPHADLENHLVAFQTDPRCLRHRCFNMDKGPASIVSARYQVDDLDRFIKEITIERCFRMHTIIRYHKLQPCEKVGPGPSPTLEGLFNIPFNQESPAQHQYNVGRRIRTDEFEETYARRSIDPRLQRFQYMGILPDPSARLVMELYSVEDKDKFKEEVGDVDHFAPAFSVRRIGR
ncbi:uncharacterized protein PSANT_00345 [Moesziomyces antarcticus]|uniref:Uncharacterized protein n=1 Tax=Pseudozyma antarctica TaxID=84753 RepID=A0A5C3FE19_PSEA2|nr:uncharacterized protein PSANT_00345 [Moesziomyces antarcticus]